MASKNKKTAPGGFSVPKKIKSTIVEVEFGSPMKNCLHYGICRVTTPSAKAGGCCPCRCLAVLHNFGGGLVQFVFDKNNLPENAFEKYFKSGFFQVDDEYEIPPYILEKIGLEKSVVEKGRYPILMDGKKMKVVF